MTDIDLGIITFMVLQPDTDHRDNRIHWNLQFRWYLSFLSGTLEIQFGFKNIIVNTATLD